MKASRIVWLVVGTVGAVLALCVVAGVAGCALVMRAVGEGAVNAKDVPGTYQCTYTSHTGDVLGAGTLVLLPGGTYTHTFTPAGGNARTNGGTWRLTDGTGIELGTWVEHVGEQGMVAKSPETLTMYAGIYRGLGPKVTIRLGADLLQFYTKP